MDEGSQYSAKEFSNLWLTRTRHTIGCHLAVHDWRLREAQIVLLVDGADVLERALCGWDKIAPFKRCWSGHLVARTWGRFLDNLESL
ncbi:hypothetical protein VNO78_16329 [Psophocarpus tetragonolobus]|uniref:Uncharacterized protein n=1 Tax=Psophocarpus tetragonolobus TaxID=3891 RepID=A0AAN9XKE0_PSOTE